MKDGRPSGTAIFTLMARARETRRPESERLLTDPYAAKFLKALGLSALQHKSMSWFLDKGRLGLATFVAARHRVMDMVFEAELESTEQVLNLGCGFDARVLRYAEGIAARPTFEVDFPATLKRRQSLFRKLGETRSLPAIERHVWVPVDFEKDSLGQCLEQAGFESGRRGFVFWEGVLYYLNEQGIHATLSLLRDILAPGSCLVFDYYDPDHEGEPPQSQTFLDRLSRKVIIDKGLKTLGEPLKSKHNLESLKDLFGQFGFAIEQSWNAPAMLEACLGKSSDRRIFDDMPVAVARRFQ